MSYKGASGYVYEGMTNAQLSDTRLGRLRELEQNLFLAELEVAELKEVLLVTRQEDKQQAERELHNISAKVEYVRARINGLNSIAIPTEKAVDQQG